MVVDELDPNDLAGLSADVFDDDMDRSPAKRRASDVHRHNGTAGDARSHSAPKLGTGRGPSFEGHAVKRSVVAVFHSAHRQAPRAGCRASSTAL